jgi:hypothetical protein
MTIGARMLGPVSLKRLSLVEPTLAQLITMLSDQMSEPIGVTQGLRTDAEQFALYEQGRASVDFVNELRKNLGWAPIQPGENIGTVTNAKPRYSWHGFGMAVDVVPLESGNQPDWDESHSVWQELVTKGEALGLTSGISWHDEPHFQLTGRFPVTPDDEVRQIFAMSGMQAVWSAAAIQTVRG